MDKKKILKYVGILVLVLMIMLVIGRVFKRTRVDDYNTMGVAYQTVNITDNIIEQKFVVNGKISGMNFLVKNCGSGAETILLELWSPDRSQCYIQETLMVPASGMAETVLKWQLEHVDFGDAKEILLVMDGKDSSRNISICTQEDTSDYSYSWNGEIQQWHLRMSVLYEGTIHWDFYCMFGLLLLVIGFGVVYAWDKNIAVEKLFAAIAIIAGIAIAMVNPFGQEPDGWLHFLRATDVSYGNVLAPYKNTVHEDGYFVQPANVNDIGFEIVEPGTEEGFLYTENLRNMKFSKDTILMSGENSYTSLFYMPQALGTLVGRCLNLSVYGCMVLGRVLNLLCYVALAYWALKLMPIYKNLLAVIALLPMSIYQAASYSPDAMLNGLCFLFVALCFYFAFEKKEELGWKNVIILGILLVLLFMCKFIYVCLGLLVFLIPVKKFGSWKNYWKSFLIAILPLIFMVGIMAVAMMIGKSAGTSGDAVITEVTTMTQLDYVKANPLALVKVIGSTLLSFFNMYVEMLNTLGWINYSLNILQTLVPFFMIGVACLDTEGIESRIKIKHRILFLITGVTVVVLGMLGLYLMDPAANAIASPVVMGYQTRYAIPVMVLLLAIFGSGKVTNRIKGFSVKVVGCMGIFLVYTLFTLVRICY